MFSTDHFRPMRSLTRFWREVGDPEVWNPELRPVGLAIAICENRVTLPFPQKLSILTSAKSVRIRRRAARPSTVFQLNQKAGNSKITATAKRKSNQRAGWLGVGSTGGSTVSMMVITSIKVARAAKNSIAKSRSARFPGRAQRTAFFKPSTNREGARLSVVPKSPQVIVVSRRRDLHLFALPLEPGKRSTTLVLAG